MTKTAKKDLTPDILESLPQLSYTSSRQIVKELIQELATKNFERIELRHKNTAYVSFNYGEMIPNGYGDSKLIVRHHNGFFLLEKFMGKLYLSNYNIDGIKRLLACACAPLYVQKKFPMSPVFPVANTKQLLKLIDQV